MRKCSRQKNPFWSIFMPPGAETADKFDIIKVNTDKPPALAERYEVKALPTLLVFKNGTHGSRITEPSSKNEIDRWLEGELA